MRFAYDTQTKEIKALHLEAELGYVLATSRVTAEMLQVL